VLVSLACSAGSPSASGSSGAGGGATGGSSAHGGSAGTGATAGGAPTGGAAAGGTSGGNGGGAAGGAGGGATGGASGGAAAGGSAGSSDASGGTGGGAGPCAIAGKLLCDDFEGEAAGSVPTGAPWIAQNCFDTTHILKVDGGAHFSGTQSLLGENIPYADCELRADLGASLAEYWVRARVFYGEAAPDTNTHEVSVFELVPAGSNASDPGGTDDPSIRVGYRGATCAPIGVELNITGGGQEETGCTGATPVANTWYCYVLHVTQAATTVTAELSIDGVDQSYTNHGAAQTQITSSVAAIRYLRLGTRSFSGTWAHPIYVDDVAVATQAIPCN
jgi:hypothetical protein